MTRGPLAEGTERLDVARLPSYGYGHRALMWWGTAGMIAIEGTVFALAIAAYFYIWTRLDEFPPSVPPPELFWGTLNLVMMLVSGIPAHLTKRAAEDEELGKVRLGLVVCAIFGVVLLALRAMEFTALNVRWDTNAYGSAVWMLLALHTIHLATDFWDSVVIAVLMYLGPLEGKRYVDVAENAEYWYFVVIAWVPIYAVIYLAPRYL
jgi:heme/copper-type cytochrome/quinol oxidase subunit 3